MFDNVFVYGTLRRGESNHGWLKGASLLGDFSTDAGYTMLDLGPYPGVIHGGNHSIIGEVYRVTAVMLARLDELEDYPLLYTRERIATRFGRAWIYLYLGKRAGYPCVASGDWCRRF